MKKRTAKKRPAPETPPRGFSFDALSNKTALLLLALICGLFYIKIVFGTGHFWEDLIHQEFPHRLFARDTILRFEFPHWNPYTFGGMPFFSAIHTGVLYPTNLLLSLLPFSRQTMWYLMQLVIVAHVFCSGATMFFFSREYIRGTAAALLAATGYMLCGFFVTHIIHSLMLYILAWLPLAALLIKKGIERKKTGPCIQAGLVLGLTIFAGHPQLTFYEFLFLAAYAALLFFQSSDRRPAALIRPFLPFIIALGISLVQLLPAMELSGQSARTEWTFEQAAEGSMSYRQLFSLLVPKLFGSHTTPDDPAPAFWLRDSFQSGYWTYWETCFYTGVLVLILGFAQLVNSRRNRFTLFCAVWFAFSLAVALGSHFFLYELLFKYVPGFGKFRIPARILFTWNFLMPVLAAQTLEQLGHAESRKRLLKPLIAGAGVCALFALFVFSGIIRRVWIELDDPALFAFAAKQTGIMAAVVIAGGAASLMLFKGRLKEDRYREIILALVAIDLFVFGFGQHIQNKISGPDHFNMNGELAQFLQRESRTDIFRANIRDMENPGYMLLRRNQGMIDNIQILAGYNPLNLQRKLPPTGVKRQLDLMNVKYGIQVNPQRRQIGLGPNPSYLPRAKMFYRFRVPGSDSLIKGIMASDDFDYRNELLLERTPSLAIAPDSGTVANTVSIVSYKNNRIDLRVETAANGILWLSELYYPAWRARLDGKPAEILRADYVFRAVELPAGSHRVTLQFCSVYFQLGALLTLVTLLGAGLWLVMLRRQAMAAGKSDAGV